MRYVLHVKWSDSAFKRRNILNGREIVTFCYVRFDRVMPSVLV